MDVVNAYWEERNLQLRTYEVAIKPQDQFDDFVREEERLLSDGAQYVVVKSPVNMLEFIWGLSARGYNYIETQFHLQVRKQQYVVPSFLGRFEKDTTVNSVTSELDIETLLAHYYDNIFDTDRISLDPYFPKDASATRYYHWTKDMISSGSVLYEVRFKGNRIGFFIIKPINETTAYPVLTGVLNEYKGKGLGSVLTKMQLDCIFAQGFDTSQTVVVSNNKDSLRLCMLFGYQITDMSYVYVKHV